MTNKPADGVVVLELPFTSNADAKRALLRGVCRRAARILREQLGYPGAALSLEAHAEGLRSLPSISDFDDEPTVRMCPSAP